MGPGWLNFQPVAGKMVVGLSVRNMGVFSKLLENTLKMAGFGGLRTGRMAGDKCVTAGRE
jgi:hypothetical protein